MKTTESSPQVPKFSQEEVRNQIKHKIQLKLQHQSLNQLHQLQNQVHHKLNQQKTGNHGQKIEQAQERKANLQRKIKEIKSN